MAIQPALHTELDPAILSIIQLAKNLLENNTQPLTPEQADSVREIYQGVMRLLRVSNPSTIHQNSGQAEPYALRTQLNAILGFADVLLNGLDGALTSGQHQGVEQIRGNAKYLLTLITQQQTS